VFKATRYFKVTVFGHSRASGNPCIRSSFWIPAFAGMTGKAATMFIVRVQHRAGYERLAMTGELTHHRDVRKTRLYNRE